MMLTLILAESALEIIPETLRNHPSVKRYSERRGKPPEQILLDRSYHHAAMTHLKDSWRRGRPDIVHFSLLSALGSPLNREGMLRIFVHTLDDHVIIVDPSVRLPRNYERFVGLIEQLFKFGKVPPHGRELLRLERRTVSDLISEISPKHTVAFSRKGTPMTLRETIRRCLRFDRLLMIVGGFPRGSFSRRILEAADEVIAIDPETLDSWTVISRIIYEYERSIGLDEKRVKRLL